MMRRRAWLVTAAATAVLSEILTSLVPLKASALPPGFPDLNSFTAVDPKPHIVKFVRGGAGVGFATPDGVLCSWSALDDPNAHPEVRCSGNIPGMPTFVLDNRGEGCATVARSGGLAGST